MYKIHHFGQHIILKITHKGCIILAHKRNWVQRYSIGTQWTSCTSESAVGKQYV
jgi:hypothetical protein